MPKNQVQAVYGKVQETGVEEGDMMQAMKDSLQSQLPGGMIGA